MFLLQNKGKAKVMKFVESKKPADVQKSDKDLLAILTNKKKQIERQIDALVDKISNSQLEDND